MSVRLLPLVPQPFVNRFQQNLAHRYKTKLSRRSISPIFDLSPFSRVVALDAYFFTCAVITAVKIMIVSQFFYISSSTTGDDPYTFTVCSIEHLWSSGRLKTDKNRYFVNIHRS